MSGGAVLVACAIVGALGVTCGGLVLILRVLWQIRGSWDATVAELHALVIKVADLVAAKEADHKRLERRDDQLDERLERHLSWHERNQAARRMRGAAPGG